MSASTEKKNRQAAREAGTDKKTLAAREEAAKKKKSKIKWTVSSIAVVLVIALVIIFGATDILYTGTTAFTVNDVKFSPAEMNYYYSTQFYNFASQYGQYAAMFGLNTQGGVASLGSQPCSLMGEGSTWKDYFLQAAENDLIQTRALLGYAKENGIELTEEEIAKVDSSFDGMEEFVKAQGFGSLDKFFAANYGSGVDQELVRQADLDIALAAKAMKQYSDSLVYTGDELEEEYQSFNGDRDAFEYAVCSVPAETVEKTDENGETVNEPTDETMAAAKAKAEDILKAYNAEKGDDALENLNAAAASAGDGASASHRANVEGSNLGAYSEWLMGSRKTGDAAVIEDNGSQAVVVFLDRSDNHYPMAQVRHILVRAAASEDGTFTDEAKDEAKAKAEDILKEWQDGDKTEDSFAELANKYSEDPGSNTTGGLYDSIYKGQMVEEFDRFCFEGHKKGDTGIVYGESGGNPGYHVMYYVGEGGNYSDYIAENTLKSQAMDDWLSSIIEALTGGADPADSHHFGWRFIG